MYFFLTQTEGSFPCFFLLPRRESFLDFCTRGAGGFPYERDRDARRKIRIKTLKETNLGVAQALFEP